MAIIICTSASRLSQGSLVRILGKRLTFLNEIFMLNFETVKLF